MRQISAIALLLSGTALAAWTSIGPPAGPLYAAAASTDDPPVLYAAPLYYPMQLVRSGDGGASWSFTAGTFSSYVSRMAVDPQDHDVVYAVASGSIYKTGNGGDQWNQLSVPMGCYVSGVSLSPVNSGLVYGSATCSTRVAVVRSTDAGATWQAFTCDTTTGLSGGSVAADPADTNVVYCAGSAADRRTFVYRSTDRGGTWTRASAGGGYIPYALIVSSADPNILLVGTYSGGISRSTDAGATWTRTGNMSDYIYCLEETPSEAAVFYAGSNVGVYRSSDTGRTWLLASNALGKDVYDVLATAVGDSEVYCVSRAGMFLSTDHGANWQPLMQDIAFGRIGAIGLAPSDVSTLYIESKDNAVYSSFDNGGSWTRCPDFLSCGIICGITVDPNDPNVVWALEGSG